MATRAPVQAITAAECLAALEKLRSRRVRVQCITNTVAQAITANVLLAAGADASMAVHPAEIAAMSRSAGALLINLGTLDHQREQAIAVLREMLPDIAQPVVLDPVFVHASPVRLAIARDLLVLPGLMIRASDREMAALPPPDAAQAQIRIVTGPVDRIDGPDGHFEVARGHPWLTQVTGAGCAVGALIAAIAAVEKNQARAAAIALTVYGAAAEAAARRSHGPGTFAMHLIDALSAVDAAMLEG